MATLLWAIFCYKASIDKQSNNISLLEVTEQLTVFGAPREIPDGAAIILPLRQDFVTMWARSSSDVPEKNFGRMSLVTPSNERVAGAEFNIDLEEHKRIRSVIHMESLPLRGPGTYQFVVECLHKDGIWRDIGRLPLEIIYDSSET